VNLPLSRSLTRNGFRTLNRVVLPVVKRGVGSPLPLGVGLVVLETVGRRSGRPRQVPLVSARIGDTVIVSTVRRPSQWVENVAAAGAARVWLGGTKRSGTATIRRGPLQVVSVDLTPDRDERDRLEEGMAR
jgi:deazaflavin-dependent oxidoreductase (nitroreductase family)